MFHKLLDVFFSAIIFILGIVLFFVILNYGLGFINYNMIIPSPYPLNQMSQVQLFERDYKISILNNKLPYQDSPGFSIGMSTEWVKQVTYFGTANEVSGHKEGDVKEYAMSLQRYNHNNNVQLAEPNSGESGFNPYGNPMKLPSSFEKDFNWYLLEGDSQVSGYMLALYKPTIYPYTLNLDNNNLANLEALGLITPSTVISVDKKVDEKRIAMYLGSMQYRFSPIPYIGYHSSGDIYAPSLVFIGTDYNNKFLLIREVSMVRDEIGSVDSQYPVYLYYDDADKKWKPMIFGSKDSETVTVVSSVQATFYSVQLLYNLVTIQNTIGEQSPDKYADIHRDKMVDSYYVVGNPVMVVDNNGNLVPYNTTVLYKIIMFSVPTKISPSIKYTVPVLSSLQTENSAEDFINSLNSINAH